MDTYFILLISFCIPTLLIYIFNSLSRPPSKTSTKLQGNLPPGPPPFPVLGNFLWLRKPFAELEPAVRNLHTKYGPVITLKMFSHPSIFIANGTLAYQALIQKGSIFADRPLAPPTYRIFNSNHHSISSATYGPTWRLLRRNLTSEILHPSRIKSYSPSRKWVLKILIDRLKSQSKLGEAVRVVDHFHYSMFCLLAFMCFGYKVEEKQVVEIEMMLRRMILSFNRFNFLNLWPSVGKILFRKHWEELLEIRKNQEDVIVPLIRARKKAKEEKQRKAYEDENEFGFSYIDTLFDLELPEEKRKLSEGEITSLCSEFLNGGADTTSTMMQWIMANMVKYQHIQAKLVEEINRVVGTEKEEVTEEDAQKIPYLKAVVLEALRRHIPVHYAMPHTVTQDVTLDGYVVPKNSTINFMLAGASWDPKLWKDPMEFNPERFLNGEAGETFDVTGNTGIKMMPFGAGRRICPGYAIAILHLEYYVANLVWNFKWTAPDGEEVDMSEKQEYTVAVMKNPLRARLSPRLN